MKLYDFMSALDKEQIKIFAQHAGTTPGYLELLKGNHRKASSDMCKKIEIASEYKVTRFDLRPDFFEDMPNLETKTPTEAA